MDNPSEGKADTKHTDVAEAYGRQQAEGQSLLNQLLGKKISGPKNKRKKKKSRSEAKSEVPLTSEPLEVEIPSDDMVQRLDALCQPSREELIAKLQGLVNIDPSVIDCQVDVKMIEKINKMSNEEITARINRFRLKSNNKISKSINAKLIESLDRLVGTICGCKEILINRNKNDLLLQQTSSNILSEYLYYIPDKLKFGLIYSMNVASSVAEAKASGQQ